MVLSTSTELATSTELVRRDSIEELIGHRDRAPELFRKIAEHFGETTASETDTARRRTAA